MIKRALKKEMRCLVSSPQGVWVALTFCLGVFLIFPFVIDADDKSLILLFPALLWISLFFSLFLTAEGFYAVDYAHHIFHYLYVQETSFFGLVLIKVMLQSVFVLILHMVLLPLLALFYGVNLGHLFECLPVMVLGVFSLSFLVHFGQLLILALKGRGMLSLLILLPLIIPVLIFASSACYLTLISEGVSAPLLYLSGISFFILGVIPYTSSIILTEAIRE